MTTPITPDGGTLTDFHRWALGDLRGNTARGILAEWLVARAIGADLSTARTEWANYDVLSPRGVRIEVKTGAYVQAWTDVPSTRIVYSGLTAREWLPSLSYSEDRRVRADVYVFALQTAPTVQSYRPLDLQQWQFRVATGAYVSALGARSVGLRRLIADEVPVTDFAGLRDLVERARPA